MAIVPYYRELIQGQRAADHAIQNRHVDLQRLWKRLPQSPQEFTGQPQPEGRFTNRACIAKAAGSGTNIVVGVNPWTNTGNITVEDGTNLAGVLTPRTGAANPLDDILVSGSHGFAIPTGATITSLSVRIKARASFTNGIKVARVSFTKDGATDAGSNLTDNRYLVLNVLTNETFGDGGLAGTTWTPAEINASTFGVRFQVNNEDASDHTAAVDVAEITVCYRL